MAIIFWRAILFLVRYDEERFRKPLASFADVPSTYIIQFDASLSGAGVLWFERCDGTEVCLGGSIVDIRFLGFKEYSAYKNLCEFIGVILGVLGLVKLGVKDKDIEVRGDSVSALTWVETGRHRGSLVTTV